MFVIGNATKASMQFVSYNHFKQNSVDPRHGITTAGSGNCMMAGLFAVTPSEIIKTNLVSDVNRTNPQYCGLVHGTIPIVRQKGITGIYRGLRSIAMSVRRRWDEALFLLFAFDVCGFLSTFLPSTHHREYPMHFSL
ncbi:hypothetical protein DFS33DRAFT_1250332 [Desarmillaria ectypa]|nr:hypothetical protein DFS33DRAFT_1250332 [Desarmillaria ectypa]